MTIHGSSGGRGHVGLILLAMLGTALVSMLALPRWDSSARADEQQKGSGQQITLERSADPAFQPKLSGATNRGDREPYIVGGTPVPDGKYPFMAFVEITFKDGTGATCGGTLIDQDSVLTARRPLPCKTTNLSVECACRGRGDGAKPASVPAAHRHRGVHHFFLQPQKPV